MGARLDWTGPNTLRKGSFYCEDWIGKQAGKFIKSPNDNSRIQSREFKERRIMLDYVKAELRRNIATTERNVKVSGEYKNNFIRIFLTLEEARDLLSLIEKHKLREAS